MLKLSWTTFLTIGCLVVIASSPANAKEYRVRLVDEADAAIANVSLAVEICRVLGSGESKCKDPVTVTTDSAGHVSIELAELESPTEKYYLRVTSDQCLVPLLYQRQSLDTIDVGCVRAEKWTSIVTDHHGKPVANAKVTLHVPTDTDYFRRIVTTGSDGRYALPVPPDRDFGVVIDSPAGSYHRMVVPLGAGEIPHVQLKQGTKIQGQLLSMDGKPIQNCVIMIQSDDSQALDTELTVSNSGYGSLGIKKASMTDADGRFQFPPLQGQFVVYLLNQKWIGKEFPGAIAPPPLAPQSLLLQQPGTQELTLQAEKSVRIKGTMSNDDGEPIPNVEIQLMQPPIHGLQYFGMDDAKTDKQGEYHFDVPVSMKNIELMVHATMLNKVRMDAWPTTPDTTVQNWRARRFRISDFAGNPRTVDWVLVPQRQTPDFVTQARENANAFSEPDVHPAIRLFESQVAQMRNDPTNDSHESLLALCFKLESKNRGTRVGLSMLHYIMRAGETSMDLAPSQARETAIDVLKEHYIDHPDLDLLIGGFVYGNLPINAEPLLRAAMEMSPHRHVRAKATYELANFKRTLVSRLPMLKGHRESSEKLLPIQSAETQKWMAADIENVKRLEAKFAGIDLVKVEEDSTDLFQQVVNQYPGVLTPTRYWEGPANVRMVDIDDPSRQWTTTVAERAEAMLFHKRLIIDKPAPELAGFDLYHRNISLADFRGRVVLLTVTNNTVSDTELYGNCAVLMKKYAKQPFTVVSVVPSDANGGYGVREIVRHCQITWPIIRDVESGQYARQWCQARNPEVYVIDQAGVLRSHSTSENIEISEAGRMVAKLLAK